MRVVETMSDEAHGGRDAAAVDITIGISACLLGEKVRFDGGHKRDAYLNDTLSRFVRFVPVCPEVDVGICR